MAQDADIVLMVGRSDEDPNHMFVKIEKNRNRGFDYENNQVALYTDRIRIYNERPLRLSDVPEYESGMDYQLESKNAIEAV